MTTRREKAKPQKPQINKQLDAVEEVKPKNIQQPSKGNSHKRNSGRWKENLGKYFIDISKYIITGVVIASLFQDVSDRSLIYGLGLILSVSTLITGLILTNKKEEDK